MTLLLSALQKDALTEIFNIGMGQAASSLSQIIGETVDPSIPTISIMRSDDQAHAKGTLTSRPRICAVSQDFTGNINASAFLVFPEGKSREIVRRMLGESVSMEELGDVEQDALCEIGNVILNSCMSSLAEMLQVDFHCSIPGYHLGPADEILFANPANNDSVLILCHIDFSLPKTRSDGYLAFLLSHSTFNALVKQVDRFLEPEMDISNCQVRWGNTGIAECMVGGGCQWAIRALGNGKLCSHTSVKQIAVYQPTAWTL